VTLAANAVASFAFGAVERAIGSLQNLFGRAVLVIAFGQTDTYRERCAVLHTICCAQAPANLGFRRALRAAQYQAMFRDVGTHRFQLSQHAACAAIGKNQHKFFITVAERAPARSHLPELRCHHLQHLVTNLVSIGVVELFENLAWNAKGLARQQSTARLGKARFFTNDARSPPPARSAAKLVVCGG